MTTRTSSSDIGRRLAVAASVAVVALLGAACGNGDDADGEETATTMPTETTLAELSDEEFDAQVDEMLLEPVAAAGTDLCALFEAAETGPSAMPSSENQVRKMVDSWVAVLEALAATEPVDEERSAVLLETASSIRAAAEEQGYDLELLSDPEFGELQTSQEFLEAADAYTTRYQEECVPEGADEFDDDLLDDAGDEPDADGGS